MYNRAADGRPLPSLSLYTNSRNIKVADGSALGRRGFMYKLQRVLSEVWLLSWLTVLLVSHFRVGYQWIQRMVFTFIYAFLLSPALAQLLWYYFLSGKVIRGIPYGKEARNFVDIYLPNDPQRRRLVNNTTIVYIPGGAWIIGYKGWAALLGRLMASMGYIFIAVDHRNFPQGTISDMVQDVQNALAWALANAEQYGGDPTQLVVVGQCSGAHVAVLSILQQLQAIGDGSSRPPSPEPQVAGGVEAGRDPGDWRPSSIKLFVALSGAYNMQAMVSHLDRRGLYRRVFMSIMEAGLTGSRAHEALPKHSPAQVLQSRRDLASVAPGGLPPILLVHGSTDRTNPQEQTLQLAGQLDRLGVACGVSILEGASHTDPVNEDPLLWGAAAPFPTLLHRLAGESRQGVHAGLADFAIPADIEDYATRRLSGEQPPAVVLPSSSTTGTMPLSGEQTPHVNSTDRLAGERTLYGVHNAVAGANDLPGAASEEESEGALGAAEGQGGGQEFHDAEEIGDDGEGEHSSAPTARLSVIPQPDGVDGEGRLDGVRIWIPRILVRMAKCMVPF